MRLSLGAASVRRIAMTSLLSFVISAITAFFLSPFIVQSLGNSRYGTWVLMAEIGGYYGLFDFGFRAAIGYLVASRLSRKEESELSTVLSSAFWTLALLGLIVLFVGASVTVLLPRLFNLEGVNPLEAQRTMALITVMLALQLPLELFSAVVTGCRRLDLVQGVDMLVRILTSVAIWLALSQGGGMVHLVSIQLAGRVVTWTACFGFARRLLGPIPVHITNVSWKGFRAVWDYGSKTFVANLALLVVGRVDTVIIGATLNVALITFYSIGRILVDYVTQAVAALAGSFVMHMTDLHARADKAGLLALFAKGTRVAALLALPMAACLALFGRSFIELWQGPQYVSGPWTQRSDTILYIWIVAQVPRWIQGMSWQLLLATYRVKFLMWLELGEAAVNLTLSLILIRYLETAGVALGTLVPAVIVHGVILPAYVSLRLNMPFKRIVRESYARPALVALLVAGIGFASIQLIGLESWRQFWSATCVTAVLGAPIAFRLGLTSQEQREIVERVRRLASLRSAPNPSGSA